MAARVATVVGRLMLTTARREQPNEGSSRASIYVKEGFSGQGQARLHELRLPSAVSNMQPAQATLEAL